MKSSQTLRKEPLTTDLAMQELTKILVGVRELEIFLALQTRLEIFLETYLVVVIQEPLVAREMGFLEDLVF